MEKFLTSSTMDDNQAGNKAGYRTCGTKPSAETEFETLKNKIMERQDVDITAVLQGSLKKVRR